MSEIPDWVPLFRRHGVTPSAADVVTRHVVHPGGRFEYNGRLYSVDMLRVDAAVHAFQLTRVTQVATNLLRAVIHILPSLHLVSVVVELHAPRFTSVVQHIGGNSGAGDPLYISFLNCMQFIASFHNEIETVRTVQYDRVMVDVADMCAPTGWRLPLLPSQMQSLTWMQQFENLVSDGENSVTYSSHMLIPGTPFLYDPFARVLVPASVAAHVRSPLRVRFSGAILADPTGSGKTATVLALLCSQPRRPSNVEVLKHRPAGNILAAVRVPTAATLIVIPLNLTKQWLKEIDKFVERSRLKVIPVFNKRDYTKLTAEAVQASDVVLTTLHFMTGKVYTMHGRHLGQGRAYYELLTNATLMREGKAPLSVFFQNFFWRRVIFDEQHELLSRLTCTVTLLNSLQGEVHWGMTGTPLLFSRAKSVLWQSNHVFNFDTVDANLFENTPGLTHAVVERGVRQTTFVNTALLPIQVRHHLVPLSRRERLMVDSHATESDATLVQLLTCYNVLALLGHDDHGNDDAFVSMTFPELAKLMVSKQDDEIERESQRLARYEADVASDTNLLEQVRNGDGAAVAVAETDTGPSDPDSTNLTRFLQRQLKVNQRLLDGCRAKVQSLHVQRDFFRAQLTPETRDCPICMEPRASVITKCGHWFCADCVRTYKRDRKGVCPVCKSAVRESEWVAVTEAAPQVVAVEEDAPHGTKLAAIATLLRELSAAGEKVVMFVQWTVLMRAMRGVLHSMGIQALLVHGNSSMRNAAIEKMQTGKADVLILSLETSTSGLNLIEANHVIFAHAMVDGSEAAIKQAISRVHRLGQTKQVHVHWFIAEGTREQELFQALTPGVSVE